MQYKLVLWATALAVAFGSMAGLAVRTARAEAAPLVISAVQIMGSDSTTAHDFIELYNPNPFPVDLNGYRIVKRSATGTTDSSVKSFSSETLIPAYSFYLWANSTWLDIGFVPDATTSATLASDNGVGLRLGALDTGTLVDSLSWGAAANGFASSGLGNPGGGESISRQDLFENIGYQLGASNPRNSGVQQLPDSVPTQTNSANCEISPSSLSVSSGQVLAINISFENSGNTVWSEGDYSVRQLTPNGASDLALGQATVNPLASLEMTLQLTAPIVSGNHTFQWQMQTGGVLFGEFCLLHITVVPTEPEPEPTSATVRITELLPNPSGDDSGKEIVELFNHGSKAINLENWVLDDIESWPASSNAFVIGSINLEAGKYTVLTIPTGKFGLNNTGGDVLTLFSPTGAIVSAVSYEGTAAEGKTYSLVDNAWHWTTSSLGIVNPPVPDEPDEEGSPVDEDEPEEDPEPSLDLQGLVISEIYAAPAPAEEEFLELYNGSDSSINLKEVKLSMGNRIVSLPEILLPAGSYYVLKGKELKLPLADSGKDIQLIALDGNLIDEASYPKARKGESYALFEDGFLWTTIVTSGTANKFAAAQEKVSAKPPKAASSSSKVVSSTTLPKVVAATGLGNQTGQERGISPEEQKSGETKPKSKPFNVLAIGLASLGAGILAIYKYGFGGI